MNYSQLMTYLSQKPEAEISYPFYPDTPVFKIKDKVFAIVSHGKAGAPDQDIPRVNLKCDPEHALTLRFFFTGVKPGYHMNKKHWNTVLLDGSVPDYDLQQMIDHSYALIVSKLTKAKRHALELNYSNKQLYGAASSPNSNSPTTGK